jgi:hypothetical protein
MRLSFAIAGMMALAVSAVQASADSVAYSPDNGTYNDLAGQNFSPVGNDGLIFTVGANNITVTALGYFHDGAVHINPVGIYDLSDNALLTSADVTTTSGVAPLPTFDYQAIAPLVLSAGQQYEVVGQEGSADGSVISGQFVVSSADNTNMNPGGGITFDGYRYDYNTSLDLPTTPWPDSYQGPNFQFTVGNNNSNALQTVPLPTSVLGGSTLIGLMFFAKARHRKNMP